MQPKFPKLDPAGAAFWDARYAQRFTPWDAGQVPPQLRDFIDSRAPPGRVLVPGCGSGHDVRAFAEAGWDVMGIDFSAGAIAAASPVLGPLADRLKEADFFGPVADGPFALVYERAFLCALPRTLWVQWAARVAQVIPPGGLLAGFFFFEAGVLRGPPFPLEGPDELEALIGASFTRLDDQPAIGSIPVFAGKERWQTWQRK